MNNDELAKDFYQGATSGKGSNMFIDGNVIYSYGYHFPIALRISRNEWIVNEDRYSHSTLRHQKLVESRLGGFCHYCNTADLNHAIECLKKNCPIVITNKVRANSVEECFRDLKDIFDQKGIKNVPIKKWKQMVKDFELIKDI